VTPGYGFGMLAVGLIVIAIVGSVLYFVVNYIQYKEKEEAEQKKNKIWNWDD
tara:strand:- start:471 stop:626 length:156 start_codon:yes stop_codon:yes gene_type:complete